MLLRVLDDLGDRVFLAEPFLLASAAMLASSSGSAPGRKQVNRGSQSCESARRLTVDTAFLEIDMWYG